MVDQEPKVEFGRRINIDGVTYDAYMVVCPACGKQVKISDDKKIDAEREGKITMPCCETEVSV